MKMLIRADFGEGEYSEEAWRLYTAAVAREPNDPNISRRAVQYGIRKLLAHAWTEHRDRILARMKQENVDHEEMTILESELQIAIQKIVQAKAYTLPNTEPPK
jgi:methionyl-tRNA synthetase